MAFNGTQNNFKPFKPLTFKGASGPRKESEEVIVVDSPPPAKKRKLLSHDDEEKPSTPALSISKSASAPRKPLLAVTNATAYAQATAPVESSQEGYYRVLWRKFTTKKNKTWDGDGILSVYGGYAHLQNEDGRDMGKKAFRDPLLPGSTLSIGGKDLEIDSMISKSDFLSGRVFLKSTNTISTPAPLTDPEKAERLTAADKKRMKAQNNSMVAPKSFYKPIASSASVSAKFKKVVAPDPTIMTPKKDGTCTPRHDPHAPNAVVMMRPKDPCPPNKQLVDVVVDPHVAVKLRDHQKEGIKFLYECVMGMRPFNGQGAILADEMGLGKTLQTIGLIWTLLKQKPFLGDKDISLAGSGKIYEGVIKKALVVCPATLLENWRKEFHKWIGKDKIGIFVADGPKPNINGFMQGKSNSVMIIGYEKLRSVQDELMKGNGFDIVIADEGHRLKTAQNKSAQAIRNLNTPRRIILSGTPIQNDLSEFFVMIDFVNPGLLGNYKTFQKEFEAPIMKSRQTNATANDIEKGSARGEELSSLTKMFILRRTGEIQAKFLPPKSEYVLFCKPAAAQAEVYQHILQSPVFGSVIGSSEASLQLITILKKVCNSPALLVQKDGVTPANNNVATLLESIPVHILKMSDVSSSSKFRVLDRLLRRIATTTSEKVVLVSNYTSTLDLLGKHLASLKLPFLRLDGSTPSAKRQDLVDLFNRTPATKHFAFLLSAKSGGVGINLIGASRLVLFDVDWNPSTDLQAMARVHRPGQRRPVKIYRLLMAGGMDEKIFQRQVTKTGLADSVVDGKKSEASFSQEELRDLFRLNLTAACQTHDLLFCACRGLGPAADRPSRDQALHPPSSPRDMPDDGVDEAGDADNDDDDDDDALPPINALAPDAPRHKLRTVPASQYYAERDRVTREEEQRMRKEKKDPSSSSKMQALMSYLHLDTAALFGGGHAPLETEDSAPERREEQAARASAMLGDEVLAEILREERCKVGFVFVKGSGGGGGQRS